MTVPTYSEVRLKRPHGSDRNLEFWAMPATARGCSAWRYSERRPPSVRIGSWCSFHVTEPGPKRPTSPFMSPACHASGEKLNSFRFWFRSGRGVLPAVPLAGRTKAPERDLRLVHHEAVSDARVQAGALAHRTVEVLDRPAAAAHDVVVVV